MNLIKKISHIYYSNYWSNKIVENLFLFFESNQNKCFETHVRNCIESLVVVVQ